MSTRDQLQGSIKHNWIISFTVVATSFLLAAALLSTGVIVIQARAQADPHNAEASVISVESVEIHRQTGFATSERFAGRVEASQDTDVAFETGGTIRELLVDEGDQVQEGDIVAMLDTRTLEAQRRQRQASRRQLSVAVERATLDLQRETELERRNLTADQSLDNARLLLEQAIAAVEEMDAVLDSLTIAIEKAAVRAPFTGFVGARYLDEGSVVAPGTPVISVYETHNPEVVIGLPIDRLNELQPGKPYPIIIDGRHFKSVYRHARPDVNRLTRTVDVRFIIEVPGNAEQPLFGQLAELELVRNTGDTGYWIPVSALVEGDRGLWSVLVLRASQASTSASPEQPDLNGGASTTGELTIHREHVDVLHAQAMQAFIQADLGKTASIVKEGGHRVVSGQVVFVTAGNQPQ